MQKFINVRARGTYA